MVCPTDSKLCIIIGQGPYSASTSLGKGEGVNKESNNKKTYKGGHAVKKGMSLSHILLHTFFSNSVFILFWFPIKSCNNIAASNKKITSKKEPTSAY